MISQCRRCGLWFLDVSVTAHRVKAPQGRSVCLSPAELREAGWCQWAARVWVPPPSSVSVQSVR